MPNDALSRRLTLTCVRAAGWLLRSTSPVWIPEGSGSDGVYDRLMVCSTDDATRCLSLIDGYLNAPMRYTLGSLRYGTPEAFTARILAELGLLMRRFPRTLFTVAAVGDPTSWSIMSDEPDATLHMRFKYWDKHTEAKAQCGKCKATTRSSAEPYCCRPSERFGLLHAAEQVPRQPLLDVRADGGRVYNGASFGRAAIVVVAVLIVVLWWLRRGRRTHWPLLSCLLPLTSTSAAEHERVRVTEGVCSPASGFIAQPSLSRAESFWRTLTGKFRDLTLRLGGGRDNDWVPVRCSQALQGFPSSWPAWPAWSSRRSSLGPLVNAHVLFVACARNVAESAHTFSAHIDSLGHPFAEHRVLVWEDSSSDGTRAALRNWAARSREVRLLLGDPPPLAWTRKLPRTARIAFCRDVLLTEALRAMPPRPPYLHPNMSTEPETSSARQTMGVPLQSHPKQLLVAMDLDCPPILTPHLLAASGSNQVAIK